jgi:hypothetical protein
MKHNSIRVHAARKELLTAQWNSRRAGLCRVGCQQIARSRAVTRQRSGG